MDLYTLFEVIGPTPDTLDVRDIMTDTLDEIEDYIAAHGWKLGLRYCIRPTVITDGHIEYV